MHAPKRKPSVKQQELRIQMFSALQSVSTMLHCDSISEEPIPAQSPASSVDEFNYSSDDSHRADPERAVVADALLALSAFKPIYPSTLKMMSTGATTPRRSPASLNLAVNVRASPVRFHPYPSPAKPVH